LFHSGTSWRTVLYSVESIVGRTWASVRRPVLTHGVEVEFGGVEFTDRTAAPGMGRLLSFGDTGGDSGGDSDATNPPQGG
jgi:hypothetical protein